MKEQKDPLQEEKSTSWYKLTWYFLKTYIWETREALEVGERRCSSQKSIILVPLLTTSQLLSSQSITCMGMEF